MCFLNGFPKVINYTECIRVHWTRRSLKCLCCRQLLVHFRSYSNQYFTESVSSDTAYGCVELQLVCDSKHWGNGGPSYCLRYNCKQFKWMFDFNILWMIFVSFSNTQTRKLRTSICTQEKLFYFILGRMISLAVSRVCFNSEITQTLLKKQPLSTSFAVRVCRCLRAGSAPLEGWVHRSSGDGLVQLAREPQQLSVGSAASSLEAHRVVVLHVRGLREAETEAALVAVESWLAVENVHSGLDNSVIIIFVARIFP